MLWLLLPFWFWLLVVGRLKIWTFAGAVNLFAFLDVVCRGGLSLLELLSLLPTARAEGLGVWVGELVFTDWDLCCGLGGGLISPGLSLLWRVGFELVSCRRGVFCFAASILRYSFFLFYTVYPTMCMHYYIAGPSTLYLRGTLTFCEGLNEFCTLYFSGSELRRDRTYNSWSIASFCERGYVSYIRTGYDPESVLLQSAYLLFLRRSPQLLVMRCVCFSSMWRARRCSQSSSQCKLLAFCVTIFFFVSFCFCKAATGAGITC